jgi:hypothetical protein
MHVGTISRFVRKNYITTHLDVCLCVAGYEDACMIILSESV